MEPAAIAPFIDHTLLHPGAGDEDLRRLAAEARRHGFAAVCANSRHVPLLAEAVEGSAVRVCTVAGFPLGAALPAAKAAEARLAVDLGAHEIDMVLSVGDLLAGRPDRVLGDVRAVREAIPDAVLKVILECGLLTDDLKRQAAELCAVAGADFVKTSTGFGHGGATVEDVRLLRGTVGPGMGVKASGGIRTREQTEALIEAGANRIGTSAGVAIAGG